MPYLVALVLVAAFTANVVFGAVGQERFVGNVGEMLILFAAAISFSVGILRSEARAKPENTDTE
jgi:type IV secretory pathway VirB2 component (pilin)